MYYYTGPKQIVIGLLPLLNSGSILKAEYQRVGPRARGSKIFIKLSDAMTQWVRPSNQLERSSRLMPRQIDFWY